MTTQTPGSVDARLWLESVGVLVARELLNELCDPLILFEDRLLQLGDRAAPVGGGEPLAVAVVASRAGSDEVAVGGVKQIGPFACRDQMVDGGGDAAAAWPLDLTDVIITMQDVAACLLPAAGRVEAASHCLSGR
jgi:hypothetical protein